MKQLTIICLLLSNCVFAQRVYHVAIMGNDHNPGTRAKPLRTISAAAKLVKPGDTVSVHAGTYRELVQPAQSGTAKKRITFAAAPGEQVIIKGSEVIGAWTRLSAGLWKVAIPEAWAGPYKELIRGDWYFGKGLHTGEVYFDGEALHEVSDTSKTADQPVGVDTLTHFSGKYTWHTTQENGQTVIYARFPADPNQHLIELNVRPACFYPVRTGVNYITVRNFEMCQAATQWAAPTAEQIGILGTNWSKGWIIENNTIHDSKCVGITLGKDRASGQNVWLADPSKDGSVLYNQVVKKVIAEGWNKKNIGSHLVRNNTVYECGAAGICGSFGAAYSRIIHNDVHDIYTYRPYWGAEMGGIKLHAAIDVLIKDNKVRNCYQGIWLDWMAQGTRVTGNVCYENDYVDFFAEVDHGPYLVDHNYLLSAFSIKDWSEGGAFVSNIIAGMLSRAPQDRATPWFKPHTTELIGIADVKGGDNRFYHNIFVGHQPKFQRSRYMAPDAVDSLSGYGLAIYDQAAQPVLAEGNVYLHGAKPLASEKGAVTDTADRAFKLLVDKRGVSLSAKLPAAISQAEIHSLSLGATQVSKGSFEHLIVDPGFFGRFIAQEPVLIWTKIITLKFARL